MESSASERLAIRKLDGENYGAWKSKVRLLLVRKGAWKVTDGTETDVVKAEHALAVIGLSVEESQIVHIYSCTSGKEAWDQYSELYENKGVANRINLLNELMTSRMSEDDKAQEHIEKNPKDSRGAGYHH